MNKCPVCGMCPTCGRGSETATEYRLRIAREWAMTLHQAQVMLANLARRW